MTLSTPAPVVRNRWIMALCGVALQLCIGSVYAYSVMTEPVSELLGISHDDVKIAFSIAIVFLGTSAAVLGPLAERLGPKRSAMLGATCWGIGLVGTGVAVMLKNVMLFYACYGVIGGIGLGISYITPVATLVKWFPDKRGLATGLAIMGFGFAAMLAAPAMAWMFNAGSTDAPLYTVASVSRTFLTMGAVYFIAMMLAAQYLTNPPAGYVPKGYDPASQFAKRTSHVLEDYTAAQAIRTASFYAVWLTFAINVTCGITLISEASPMMQSLAGMTALQAGTVVGMLGIFNGLGRIGWSAASDYLGRPLTYTLFFVIQIPAFWALAQTHHPVVLQTIVFLILTCYGGGFATVPAYLGDMFGSKRLASIYGLILTAWAFAGVAGPSVMLPVLRKWSGSNELAFYANLSRLCIVLFLVAFTVSLIMLFSRRATSNSAGFAVSSKP